MSETILYQVNNGVASLTLNRPARMNALTDAMLAEMVQALKQAGRDKTVRAVLLTGAGRAFCAGQDLGEFPTAIGPNQIYDHLMTVYRPLFKQFQAVEKPIIGAINGAAAGAGASLALACDLRIMAPKAYLMLAFSNLGLIPDAGATWFLARQIGYSRAFELAIEAEQLPAERCLALGLTNRIVEPDSLLTEATTWAERLAQRPTYALGLTKRALQRALTSSLDETFTYEAHLQQLAAENDDFAEGLQAFKEKRAPNFKGH